MAYDDTSRKQDAAAHNAEIGFVESSMPRIEVTDELMARALANVMNDRYRSTGLTKFIAKKMEKAA